LVGGLTARNRFLQPARSKLYSEHGVDTRRDLDYYVARAKGGVGLLITGERLVHPTSPVGRPRFAYSYLPSMIERDRVTTKAVHQHDTLIFAQMDLDDIEDVEMRCAPTRISSLPSSPVRDGLGEDPVHVEDAAR
jgi:2,4-dienoyl-CoA reductase-like NADH-dependent reductase (Old Yellow Enzyme family)